MAAVRTDGGDKKFEESEMSAGTGTLKASGESKRIALTFDDGPHPVCTPQLLDGLKARGVKASFFITGQNAEKYPELVERMQREGHLIGNHTYSHIQLTKQNREQFREELVKTNGIIREITGEDPVFVRPPYGSWDKKFEEELNMFPVLWTIDPLDWCTKDAGNVARRVISKAKENAVILMHDEYDSTVRAALSVVDALQGEGYEFVTVEEILFD
ncbi:MAG: polysaccharide deacetylase family protein [Firmicutes bacterium]|nr:polysaccharide deacetylase family protein [Bacillota bacterium]